MKKALKNYFSIRTTAAYMFTLCCCLLLIAAYVEVNLGVEPCPLCALQRLMWFLLSFFYFALMLYKNPSVRWVRVNQWGCAILASIGLLIAGKQVWMQSMPADAQPSCGPGLAYILENLPLSDAIYLILHGSGQCADPGIIFLGLSMAAWSFILFTGVIILSLINIMRAVSRH